MAKTPLGSSPGMEADSLSDLSGWTLIQEKWLQQNYMLFSVAECAKRLGKTEGAVRGKKERLGLNTTYKARLWTKEEESILKQFYAVAGESAPINLHKLAKILNKDRSNICRKAKEMGLPTNQHRQVRITRSGKNPLRNKQYKLRFGPTWEPGTHPRGMLGKKHSEDTKEIIRQKSLLGENWKKRKPPSQEQRLAQSLRSIALNQSGNGYSRTTKGWLEVGGKRKFYKSKWEMGYANYLEFLKQGKAISDWDYEVDTFWFEKIRRGVRSYTPDFKVTNKDGSIEYHEVKGWMDAKSKVKLKRMRIYYPKIKVTLVGESEYRALKRQFPSLFTVTPA